jgi:hypothetical protein
MLEEKTKTTHNGGRARESFPWLLVDAFFPLKCAWMVPFPLEWNSTILCSKHYHTIHFQRNEKLQSSF